MTPDQINQILNELTTKLSPAANQAFVYAVRYQMTSALLEIIACVIGLVGLALINVLTFMYWRRHKGGYDDTSWMPLLVTIIVGTTGLGLICAGLPDGILRFTNPEFSALLQLLGK